MAKISKKLKKFGTPPTKEEVEKNFNKSDFTPKQTQKTTKKIDGRSLRKTGFTQLFSTRVPEGFKEDVIFIAQSLNKTLGQTIVKAVTFYKKELQKKGKL